ncbi:MAG: zf-HC2 domain-containing protein [Syntrophomonadaceae bacterium]|nr:zf-HC2 domain-containing protein [Syntrophomonadaceae bacterium]
MKCQHVDRYIYDFCDNRLSPDIHNEIESHLRECEPCRLKAELTQLENEVLSDKSTIPALSGNFTDKVMENLSPRMSGTVAYHKTIPSRFKISDLAWTAALMAIVLLMIVIAPQLIPGEKQLQVADQPEIIMKDEALVGNRANTVKIVDSGKAVPGNSAEKQFFDCAGTVSEPTDKTSKEPQQVAMALNYSAPIANNQVTDNHTESATPSRKSVSAVPAPISAAPANAEFPYPVNIPASYCFTNADRIDNRTAQYSYRDAGQRELSVIVTNLQSKSDDIKTAMLSDNLSRDEARVNPESNPNEIVFEINGVGYAATLSGNISVEEVKDLTKVLKFALDASVTAP